MTEHVLHAWQVDIENRVNGPDKVPRAGCGVNVHEIGEGLVFEDPQVRVTAFPARHGDLENALGFRFETPDKVIVISGDTAPTKTLEKNCDRCDILIHEAYSQHTYERVDPQWQSYRRQYHTSSVELAEIANRIKPGLLVLYHRANPGGGLTLPNPESVLLDEIRHTYKGPVLAAHDLDVF